MRGRFRIVDPECLDVVGALRQAFEAEGVRYALVGGIGVQAWLASRGLDHLLRCTGDVDVAVHAEDARVVRALNSLAATHPRLPVVQNVEARNARVGKMNVDYVNEPSRLRGMEAHFYSAIDEAPELEVRRVRLRVEAPEFLVAAKLTGHKIRPQDELDIVAVLRSGVAFDAERVKDLVAPWPGRFERLLALRRSLGED